jgi:H+/Cl- antiporter ClcA
VTRQRLRSAGAAAGAWVRRANYLPKWVVLGAGIGVIAGLGAVAFYRALRFATWLFLHVVAGYAPPFPVGESGGAGTGQFPHWWLIPIIVCLGGLVSGVLVLRLAPEAEGHGTDAAIDAVHTNPRMVRTRAVVVKLVSSAVTIGSGGSGGREGPTAQISAGFGSLLARTLDLSPEDGRTAVSVGIGAGIGSIFSAPLGGAVLAADIVYMDDFEVEALIPGLIASIIGYTVFGLIDGFHPMFGYAAPGYEFHQPIQLLWFALIGVCAGLVGLAYSTGFHGTAALFRRLRVPAAIKPALGGLLTGLLALALPEVLGTGYGWVQHALDRGQLLDLPVWVVLLLPFGKILATALSIGSGGSGGIFGPGMVIGAFTGAAVWRLLEPIAPGMPSGPAPFVIVGMMACFGAIARAPLAMMLMVAEMTGSLTILAPAMVAVGLAYLIVRRSGQTIYRSQLRNRDEARGARLRVGMPLLGRVPVGEAMAAPRVVLTSTTSSGAGADAMRAAGVSGAPVVDAAGQFLGDLALQALAAREDGPDVPVSRLVDATAPSVTEDADLDQALDALPPGHPWLTVLGPQRQVRGILALSDVVRAYRRAVRADARRISRASANAVLIEEPVGEGSPLVDHPLREAALPEATIVLSVQRGDSVSLGLGNAAVAAGDVITMLARPDYVATVRALLGAAHPDRDHPEPAQIS